MADLYLMVGIPGIGKSTWMKNHIGLNDLYVSRDKIRFSILKEGEEYFSHEKEVYREMVHQIEQGLKKGLNVYVDATHLNKMSRDKLKYNIDCNLYKHIYAIYIKGSLQTAIERNNNRKGTKTFVPLSALKRMAEQLTEPTIEEGFNKIYIIENDKMKIISEGGHED